jgi:arginine exporter protein ArgO
LLEGLVAGYGIAIPVGAIAILIIETGIRRGFWSGFSAGAGAATADLAYASVAAIAGAQLAEALGGYADSIQMISGLVLLLIGVAGIWRIRRRRQPAKGTTNRGRRYPQIYLQFLGLTLLNPLTVAYFAALVLGLDSLAGMGVEGRLAFVAGAGLASLSWQTLLAAVSGLGNRIASKQAQAVTSYLGNAIVIGLGIRILLA